MARQVSWSSVPEAGSNDTSTRASSSTIFFLSDKIDKNASNAQLSSISCFGCCLDFPCSAPTFSLFSSSTHAFFAFASLSLFAMQALVYADCHEGKCIDSLLVPAMRGKKCFGYWESVTSFSSSESVTLWEALSRSSMTA
jgi:hypothetical protein